MNKKCLDWMKNHKNLIKALIMSFLPLLAVVLLCAADGKTVGDLSLQASEWNDELFYYKQVESILEYGFPQGYFGFNESHAQYLSFAAWSPVLVFPWIIWGFLFGWGLMSPIYCNLFFMMLAVFVFVLLTKPGRKQLAVLAVLYLSNLFLSRYILSCMPEALCAGMAVIFLAVCRNYRVKEKGYKLAVLFGLVFLMTLMRPYLLMFILFPAYYCIRKYKWKGAVFPVLTVAASFAAYVLINKYLSAEYFAPLFKTEWLFVFRREGLKAGIVYNIKEILHQAASLWRMLKEGVLYGLPAGVLFLQFLLVTVILGIQSLAERKKKESGSAHIFLFLYCVMMLVAVIVMYKLTEGSRHLVTFITMAVFAVGMMETKYYKKAAVTAAVFFLLYQRMPVSPYFYQLPYKTEQKAEEYRYWEEVFTSRLSLNQENVPNFDNVVIWTLDDIIGEDKRLTEWQMLYALPEGFGISCCKQDYVTERFEELQSKYIAVMPEGTVEEICIENGKTLIGSSPGLAVYQLR